MPTKTFKCYEVQSSTDTGIARPWPKCGMMNPPGSITCTVVITGSSPGVCPNEGTHTGVVFSRPNVCSVSYSNPMAPVAIIWAGGFVANQYDTGSPIVGWDAGGTVLTVNNGSCTYNKKNNRWEFSAGVVVRNFTGANYCDTAVTITGIG